MNATITNPINLIIIIIGLFLGLILGTFLLFNNSAKNKANIYLGILVLLSVTYFGQGFLNRFGLLAYFPHFIGTYRIVNFLIGPLTYLYVRACTQKGFEMHPILWLHFLPFGVDFLFAIPFFMQSGGEKIAYFLRLLEFGDLQRPLILHILISIHSITYFVLAVQLTFQYKKQLSNKTSAIDHNFHTWVLVFIAIHTLPVLGVIVAFLLSNFGKFTMLLALFGFFIFSVAILIAIMVKPELFHTFPHQMLLPESSEEQKQKYENSKLQAAQKDDYTAKIIAYVEREKPFQSPELTLAELAEKVNIPAHYVSQIINEKLAVNFLDFINGYRVKAAQEMLTDAKWSHYTIISIAYEAGFNAKSTFYVAFKKQTGMTPSQYRKRMIVAG